MTEIIVHGCNTCPACDENDMATGYHCKFLPHPDNHIHEDEKYQIITPEWCPLKKSPILLTYKDG